MTDLKRGRWSTPELVKLRTAFPRARIERIARTLNRSVASVRSQAHRLFRRSPDVGPWSLETDAILRRAYGVVDFGDLSVILGRSVAEIEERARLLRERTRRGRWAPDEIALLKELYAGRDDVDLEVCLSRSADDIVTMATELCLRKDKGARQHRRVGPISMPRWTDVEVARLRALYPTRQNLEIAREIGRSVTSVANKAHQLGLKKSNEVRKQIGAANAAARSRD